MKTASLYSPNPPWISVAVTEPSKLGGWAKSVEAGHGGTVVVRQLAGTKMASFRGLFDEFGAVLQFPGYFGGNYNALKDCLTDLAWLPGDAYVLIITDGASVLAHENQEDFAALVRLLQGVCEEWSQPVHQGEAWDREAVPFHVIFSGSAKEVPMLRRRLESAGAAPAEIEIGVG